MKIAYVITRADEIGGAHIHVRDLAAWLSSQGHEVLVFVGGEGPYIDLLKDASLPYIQLEFLKRPIMPLKDLKAIHELKAAISKFNPDVVSAHSAKAGLVARLACFFEGIPCIFTAHGWAFTEGVRRPASFVFRLLEKVLAPLSAAIITVCEADRVLALEKGIASSRKLHTIHNGMPRIDYSTFDDNQLSHPNIPNLVMVARFEEQKDHRTLILALSLLKDLEWNLQLVGDGPLVSNIKSLADESGIYDKIEFLGRRRDVDKILFMADIFVLSTKWEGFPRSILEAMRAQLPVVATNVAGIPEAVVDSETGFLVPVQDHVALSEKIRSLLESPCLREALGQRGKQNFLENFTFERMANDTVALYEDVLSNG